MMKLTFCIVFLALVVNGEEAAVEKEEAAKEPLPELSPEELAKQEKEACKDGQMDYLYPSGGQYKGSCKDGVRSGKGRYTYADGSLYDGNWEDDEKEGYGSYFIKKTMIFFDGRWKNGKQHGAGFVYTSDGASKFLGTWEDGEQKSLRKTTFREIENLKFYALEGVLEVPDTDAGPAKPVNTAPKKDQDDFEL